MGIETLISNPLRLFDANIFKKQTLAKMHCEILHFLYIMRLRNKLFAKNNGKIVKFPFIAPKNLQYFQGQSVALSSVASNCMKCLVLPHRKRVMMSTQSNEWFYCLIDAKKNCLAIRMRGMRLLR